MTFVEMFQTHTLIAGCTGSGKSVLLNNFICDALNTDNTHLILCDPKKVEFAQYRKCKKVQYFNDIKGINGILKGIQKEEKRRYKEMQKKELKQYDGTKIYVVIDEIADLLLSYGTESKTFNNLLVSMLCTCRASNIQFVIATQTPNRKVLDGRLMCNLPTMCGLRCKSGIESRQIIGANGCENLPKYGFFLLNSPEYTTIKRVSFGVNADYIAETIRKMK